MEVVGTGKRGLKKLGKLYVVRPLVDNMFYMNHSLDRSEMTRLSKSSIFFGTKSSPGPAKTSYDPRLKLLRAAKFSPNNLSTLRILASSMILNPGLIPPESYLNFAHGS